VPHPFELPWMRRAVVPLMRAGHPLVDELVVNRLPCPTAVVGALHHLSKPSARLRGVYPVWIGRRSFDVIELPAAEMRAADVPPLALAVGGQDERAFPCADEYSYFAHDSLSIETASDRHDGRSTRPPAQLDWTCAR